jgi:dephospho-CoA kinase
MLILGITGGIGSGKGLATEFFRTRGAAIVDADEVARELMAPGSDLLADVATAFGRDIVLPDGSLDRRRLAQAVFSDPGAVARLNAITHPPIRAAIERQIARVAEEGTAQIVCIVAPLLLEAGYRSMADRVLVMVADEQERVRRVTVRDGLTEDQVRRRMAVQMPACEQARQADWVIDTTQGTEAAAEALEAVWQELNE